MLTGDGRHNSKHEVKVFFLLLFIAVTPHHCGQFENVSLLLPLQKEECKFSAKDWCAEADDWGGCDGAESSTCALQMLGLNAGMSSSASGEAQCVSQLQELRLSEAADVSGSLNTDLLLREEMVMATSVPVFHSYYISVVDEADYAGFLDTDHANKLLKEYQQREGVDLEHLMSER